MTRTFQTTALQEAAIGQVIAQMNAQIMLTNAQRAMQNAQAAAQGQPQPATPDIPAMTVDAWFTQVISNTLNGLVQQHQDSLIKRMIDKLGEASSDDQFQVLDCLGLAPMLDIKEEALTAILPAVFASHFKKADATVQGKVAELLKL